MAKAKEKNDEKKKIYIRTYIKPDGTKLVLRSDQVKFDDMSPKVVRKKYNIEKFVEVKDSVEFI